MEKTRDLGLLPHHRGATVELLDPGVLERAVRRRKSSPRVKHAA